MEVWILYWFHVAIHAARLNAPAQSCSIIPITQASVQNSCNNLKARCSKVIANKNKEAVEYAEDEARLMTRRRKRRRLLSTCSLNNFLMPT